MQILVHIVGNNSNLTCKYKKIKHEVVEKMTFEKRSIAEIYIFGILTIGIYFIYWQIKTKQEMNKELNANIPTCWLLIIPIANIYWLYKYTECFVTKVKRENDFVIWFILFWFLGIIMPYIVQTELNKIADNPHLLESLKHRDRYCPNCGRRIPFDANICPYCAKKFESYIK